jgi:hypothetical protein
MKRYVVVLLLLSMAIGTIPAHAYQTANQYYCTGSITFLALNKAGVVEMAGPGGVTVIHVCVLGATVNGWIPDTCSAAYATLLAAKLSGQQVNLIFFDSLSCTTQPAYSDSTESNLQWVGPA